MDCISTPLIVGAWMRWLWLCSQHADGLSLSLFLSLSLPLSLSVSLSFSLSLSECISTPLVHGCGGGYALSMQMAALDICFRWITHLPLFFYMIVQCPFMIETFDPAVIRNCLLGLYIY